MPRPLLLLLAALAAGCGGAGMRTVSPSPLERDTCLIGAGGDRDGAVLAAAAGPDTALLSAARSRTPLALDCEGTPRPRLAAAWSHDSARLAWTLTLDDAAGLATAWRARADAIATLRHAGVTSVVPLDEHRLVLTFGAPQHAVPGVFADPAVSAPRQRDGPGALRLLAGAGTDLRDALDRGADLVVTSDPAVLEYGDTRSGWTRHALPWNRTYVLLAPADSPAVLDIPAGDSASFRDALARDAVRAPARGAGPPFWWERTTGCSRATLPGQPAPEVVLYAEDDPVSRSLAERVVALARSPALIARGLPRRELQTALARGAAAAFVIAVPRMALVPCREIAGWPASAKAIPLVETRPWALVHDGVGPLAVDYDGGLVPRPRR